MSLLTRSIEISEMVTARRHPFATKTTTEKKIMNAEKSLLKDFSRRANGVKKVSVVKVEEGLIPTAQKLKFGVECVSDNRAQSRPLQAAEKFSSPSKWGFGTE